MKSKRMKKIKEIEHEHLVHTLEDAAKRLEESTKVAEKLKKGKVGGRKGVKAKGERS